MNKKSFIPLHKIAPLEDSIKWLSNYKTPTDEAHLVGNNLIERDLNNTILLRKIGELNKKREVLITQLINNSKSYIRKNKS